MLGALAAAAHAVERRPAKVYGIVIHGGAGAIDRSVMTPEDETASRAALDQALRAGHAVLEAGGRSLDAVEAAVVVLEDSPLFNAGRGSVFTHEGTIEMDASIMDGARGEAGAVAAVSKVRNPIRAARRVLDGSPHVLLAGAGAEAFAVQQGLPLEPPEYFRTEQRWRQLEAIRDRDRTELDHGSGGGKGGGLPPAPADKFGTVGAVALDRHGNLAAATSTGGMTNKRFGRVGDSPIIGAGTFARNGAAAVSCTGHGEFFIREAAAHSVAARMAFGGQPLAAAARAVIFEQIGPAGGRGGLIAIDAEGRVAMPYNTGGMFRGHYLAEGTPQVWIWEDR